MITEAGVATYDAHVLLERERQLAALHSAYEAAHAGRGRIVLVTGEAGCGKSSLVQAFAEASGGTAWWGYCDPLTTPRPLGPLRDIAEEVGGRFFELVRTPGDAFERFSAFLDVLRDRDEPVLAVIEDLHWADEATLSLLQYLCRRIMLTRAVVLVTYRDDEIGPDHPARRALGDLARHPGAVQRITVEALSRGAVDTLAAEAGLNGERIFAIAAGNAFFTTELIDSSGALPQTVRDAVAERVQRLPASSRDAVGLVATDAHGLERLLANSVPGIQPEAIGAALDAGVLVARGDTLVFRHELARLAVLADLSDARRRSWHAAVLDALEPADSPPGARPDHARLVEHARGAGDGPALARLALAAGREALVRGSAPQAEAFLAEAIAQGAYLGVEDLVTAHIDHAEALARLARGTGRELALADVERARDLAAESGDAVLTARAMYAVGVALWRCGRADEGMTVTLEAVDLLHGLEPSERRATVLRGAATLAMLRRRHRLAMDLVKDAASTAAAAGSPIERVRAQLVEGTVELVTGDPDRGIELLLEAHQVSSRMGDGVVATEAFSMLGTGGGEAKRYRQAYDWLTATVEAARARDDDYGVRYAQAWQARIRFEQGRWDEAADLTREPLEAGAPPATRATALGVLGRLRVRRGDPSARPPLNEALAMRGLELQHRWPHLCAMAELLWFEGRLEAAAELLRGPLEQALETDSRWAQGEVGFWLARVGGPSTPAPLAAEPFRAMIVGEWRRAADLWNEIGCPYEEALALADGDDEALRQAISLFDRLGAGPASGWARSKLRERGAVVPRGPRVQARTHPYGLTAREAEVHALMLDGLSNAGISRRLFISRKTVEHHVSAVLAKYDARSRTELAELAGSADGIAGDPQPGQ